ncbi:MAG: sulfatase [bacterium]|nr:sulfatase [bacterium]
MKNIVLIAVDTLRPDHLGCYGYGRETSPVLDGLAQRGVVLDALWSASNFTAPAFTSLFTGLYPHQHGIFDFHSRAPRSIIHEQLIGAGYQTGAVVTFRFFQHLLAGIWGPVEAVTDTRSHDYAKDLPLAVSASACEWLDRRDASRPFALFLHYDGPHMPYRLPAEHAGLFDEVPDSAVPDEWRRALYPQEHEMLEKADASVFSLLKGVNWGRRRISPETLAWIRDKYDAAVRYNDDAVGRVLEHLERSGLAEETVICVVSDHGEAFLEHGEMGHGAMHLHEEVIRTVGILAGAGVDAGRVSMPLSHIDLWPALLDLGGVAGSDATPVPRLTDALGSDDRCTADAGPVFCQGKFRIAVRRGNLKYIRPYPSPTLSRYRRLRLWVKMLLNRRVRSECYNLDKDPSERVSLIGDAELWRPLAADLRAHLRSDGPSLGQAESADESERKRIEQEMKDLGYM